MDTCSDESVVEKFKKQKERLTQWQQSKKIDNSIAVGDKVDVRDRAYVWCKGSVKMIVESQNRDSILLVHFEGFDETKDEVLFKSSPRLAKSGVYTSR